MLTRLNVSRCIAVACIASLGLAPAVAAHAITTSDRVAATTQAIDATAQRWFAAQADAARLDDDIANVQHRIDDTERQIAQLRKIATARALVLYKSADLGVASIFGDSALDTARRAHLVGDANAGGDAAIAQLVAAIDSLHAQRDRLQRQRADQQRVLATVASQRETLDAQLSDVRMQARREADAAVAGARDRAAKLRATARVRALASTHTSDPLAAPTGAPLAPARFVATPAPAASGGVSPHHNDPFLVCTRARESGGRYDAVSPSGYYGAYQFLPSTWDATAVHAGRGSLVGVLPSRASAYDQDELAWTLYQWQGKGPWGGRC